MGRNALEEFLEMSENLAQAAENSGCIFSHSYGDYLKKLERIRKDLTKGSKCGIIPLEEQENRFSF